MYKFNDMNFCLPNFSGSYCQHPVHYLELFILPSSLIFDDSFLHPLCTRSILQHCQGYRWCSEMLIMSEQTHAKRE